MRGLVRLFSEHVRGGPIRWPDHKVCFGGTVAQYLPHILQRYRYAACCRGKTFSCDMKENCASAALNSWPLVMAGFHHNVIEAVGTFEIFVSCRVG